MIYQLSKKLKLYLVFFIIILFTTGFEITIKSRIKDPVDANDTLIIGRVILRITESDNPELFKGDYRKLIKVHFKNLKTNEVTIINSKDRRGLFYLLNPESGDYQVTKITYKNVRGGKLEILTKNKNIFTVKKGKVNNIGLLEFNSDLVKSEHENLFYRGFKRTRKRFEKKYPESKWNFNDWMIIKAK